MTGNLTVNVSISDEDGNMITQTFGMTGTPNVVAAYLRGIATDLANERANPQPSYPYVSPFPATIGTTGVTYGVGTTGGASGYLSTGYSSGRIDESKLAQGNLSDSEADE